MSRRSWSPIHLKCKIVSRIGPRRRDDIVTDFLADERDDYRLPTASLRAHAPPAIGRPARCRRRVKTRAKWRGCARGGIAMAGPSAPAPPPTPGKDFLLRAALAAGRGRSAASGSRPHQFLNIYGAGSISIFRLLERKTFPCRLISFTTFSHSFSLKRTYAREFLNGSL
ncbi:hypothetical protein EVAR_65983_1 [Eumeta japonica]|uniref:Uncharacterized protein n=1 Tax=Eumeta variegata TaxID=151549 RepID=A0A4C2AG08_EUMVA|nr:hypothetical protein EVAR_65983_1 [Eumeta japonica]